MSQYIYICGICSAEMTYDHPISGQPTCNECGHKAKPVSFRSADISLALTITALIFFIPANIFPFMTVQLYGNSTSSTIWTGVVSLLDNKSYGIALIVFVASIILPLFKLLILAYLSLSKGSGKLIKFKTKLYEFVEFIGRWSMLDIFILAILVSAVKLGNWTTVTPNVGAVFFALVVVLTTISSALFDPRVLLNKGETLEQ